MQPTMQRIEGSGPRGLFQRLIFFFSRRMFGHTPSSMKVWANHRRTFFGAVMMEGALASARGLSKREHVLADLAAAREIGCRYCLDIGSYVALRSGLTPEELQGLHDPEGCPSFSESERAVVAFAGAMSQTPPTIDDALMARVREHFSTEQIVELAAVVGWEQYRSRINVAAGLAPDGFLDAEVCALPRPRTDPTGLARVG